MLGDYKNIANAPMTPRRDLYWSEKTLVQKCETLADLLVEAHRKIRELEERADEMGQHGHHPHTGMVLVPPRDRYGGRLPIGYCHEEFMLGRAPAEHYRAGPVLGSAGWAGEAQAEGSLPVVPHPPEPPLQPAETFEERLRRENPTHFPPPPDEPVPMGSPVGFGPR